MSTKFYSRLQLLAAAVLVTACAAPSTESPSAAASAERPRLVVFMAIDGLPQRQVTAYRDQLAPDGFRRFLDRGAWFSDAHYRHGFTVTAAGHATMLTGTYPHRTGIIGNEWLDPVTGASTYCTEDTAATYIGNKTGPHDGTSPRNLKVDTVGDVLRKVDARSKVISISGKDRGAILPGGHAGTAYMYQSSSGQFASTTYYQPRHPAWVDAFNGAKPADRWFKGEWKPLLPDAAYARSLPDNQPWYGANGKLPRPLGGANLPSPGPAYYGSLLPGPYADTLSLEFARAAIAGEQLGADEKSKIEAALKDAEAAVKGDDKADIEAKSAALAEAAHKLAEKMYAAEQAKAQGAQAGGAQSDAGKDEGDIDDAEFTEVKDNK